jgi:DNA-binding transcriptional MerR regulator
LHKLKKIGFPEKNIKALVRYANQNDREVIKGVSRVANSDPEQVIGNIETLLYERKQVEAIDQWEDQQKLRIKIRSALKGRPRLGTAS